MAKLLGSRIYANILEEQLDIDTEKILIHKNKLWGERDLFLYVRNK
jgi:hypothetical protein